MKTSKYSLNMNNIPKVFDMYYKRALKNTFIKKPISWALYHTWKWADEQEEKLSASKKS